MNANIRVSRDTTVWLHVKANQASIEDIEAFLTRLRQMGCDTQRPMVICSTDGLKAKWEYKDASEGQT
jgi:hypothetical protein